MAGVPKNKQLISLEEARKRDAFALAQLILDIYKGR